MHAGVRAEDAAVVVDHRAGARRLRRLALDERRVVAIRNEADLLAVGLLRHVQLQALRVRAHGVLVEVPDGKRGARQVFLRQREQEIGLSFELSAPRYR